MLTTILVALDSSKLADQLVEAVMQLKLPPDAKVVLAHVMATPRNEGEVAADTPQVNALDVAYRDRIEQELQGYQATIPYNCHLEIVSGDPGDEIIRLSYLHKADLIILGSRGLTGMSRILQGSVSSQVVADAACSVLVIKPKDER